jgi:Cu(I)/Ag(I) efflux system periplasmic protein CusF
MSQYGKDWNMNIKNRTAVAAFALSLSLLPAVSFAQDAMIKGEVKKIDATAGKITLKHGAIKKLDMDENGMTMVFRVEDPAMLKQVKVGDKVLFDADQDAAGLTITKLQKSK